MAADANDALWREIRDTFASGGIQSYAAVVAEVASADLAQEYPQSGEAFRGRDRIVEMNQAYPSATGTEPSFTLRDVRTEGGLGVVEGTINYGDGTPVSYVGIFEARDGKVTRVTEYFANPFPAADWRKPFAAGA